jgi:hypothetical protein
LHIRIRRQHYFDNQQPGFEITHHALMLIIAQSPEATN